MDQNNGATRIATADEGGKIIIWDSKSRNQLQELPRQESRTTAIALDKHASLLAVGDFEGVVKFWAADDRGCFALTDNVISLKGPITCLTFKPDGPLLAVAANNDALKVVDTSKTEDPSLTIKVNSGQRALWRFGTHQKWAKKIRGIFAADFSPNGKQIAVGCTDNRVIVYDSDSGEQIQSMTIEVNSFWGTGILSVAFNHSGNELALGGRDGRITICDTNTGTILHEMRSDDLAIRSLTYDNTGQYLFSGSASGAVRFWHVDTASESAPHIATDDQVTKVEFVCSERAVWVANWTDTVRLRGNRSGLTVPTREWEVGGERAVAISSDARLVLLEDADHRLTVWDSVSGSRKISLAGHENSVSLGVFSPDHRWLISSRWNDENREVERVLWDLNSGKGEALPSTNRMFDLHAVSFFPNSDFFALLRDGTCIVMSVVDNHIRELENAEIKIDSPFIPYTTLETSPDGKRLLANAMSPKSVQVWDVATGKLAKQIPGHVAGAFSPNSRELITCWPNGNTLHLWDVTTGTVLQEYRGHTRGPHDAEFSRNGDRIVSCADDKTVRIWDARSGKLLKTLKGHLDRIDRVCFSADGSRVASIGIGGEVKVWLAETGDELLELESNDARASVIVDVPIVHEEFAFTPDRHVLVHCYAQPTVWLRGSRGDLYLSAEFARQLTRSAKMVAQRGSLDDAKMLIDESLMINEQLFGHDHAWSQEAIEVAGDIASKSITQEEIAQRIID